MSRHRHRRRRYATGRYAIAECERSGQKMMYKDLVEDGHIPGLLVHPDWYEPRNPQELPVDTSDAVALWRPAPEKSVPAGEFDTKAEFRAWIIASCPTSPLSLQFNQSTTGVGTVAVGATTLALTDALAFNAGECIFIELVGGGWEVNLVAVGCVSPSFQVQLTCPIVGNIAPTPIIFIGSQGNQDPLLTGNWVVS